MFRQIHFRIRIKENPQFKQKKIIAILLAVIQETRSISHIIVLMFDSERVTVLKLYILYNIT